MKKNIGSIDAVIRIVLFFVLAYIYYTNTQPGSLHTVGLILAGYTLVTSVFGNDPFYRAFKVSTNKGVAKCNGCKDKTCVNCHKGVCNTCGTNKTCTC